MHKVFISYHHRNDQRYKNHLVAMGEAWGIFTDRSVNTGDIPENWETQTIRRVIRDDYLRDSTVTILLCGEETRFRKHVDWELKSSMIDGQVNKRSGVIVITLPSIYNGNWHVAHSGEKAAIYPDYTGGWTTLETKSDYERRHPNLPERIIDNLFNPDARISVCPWDRIEQHPDRLQWLIEASFQSRLTNRYDTSLPMRMRDYNPMRVA